MSQTMATEDPPQRPGAPDPAPGSPEPAGGDNGGLLGWVRRLRRARSGDGALRDELTELIEGRDHQSEPFDKDERALLANTLNLRHLTAADVMIPRADIVAVAVDSTLEELIRVIGEEGHSRLPVYRDNLDEVVGMVHIKDVLAHVHSDQPFRLAELMRRVLFIAPSMRVLDLLLQMRLTRVHLALVVDEFGGIDGLVTIEDLVEEIVGEIEDEHDLEERPQILPSPDGSLVADARIPIEEFEARFGPVLDEEEREEVETLGGLVVYLAGRVPVRGELVRHPSGFEIEVMEADPRRVKRLRLRGPARASHPAGDAG